MPLYYDILPIILTQCGKLRHLMEYNVKFKKTATKNLTYRIIPIFLIISNKEMVLTPKAFATSGIFATLFGVFLFNPPEGASKVTIV